MKERGSILPLIGGAAVLALVMVFGVVSATSLLIERQRLFALADATAVSAAESFDPKRVVLTSSGIVAPMTSEEVRMAAISYLSRAGEGALRGVILERAVSRNSRHAEIAMSTLWQPPLVSVFFPSSMRLSVTVQSQPFIR